MTADPCPVNRTVNGRECDGPATYYCDSELWGSACRRHFEQARMLADDRIAAIEQAPDADHWLGATEDDRKRARRMWLDARYADPADPPEVEDVIAAALAEGRDRLRADLLALADDWETHALTEEVWGEDNPERTGGEFEKGYWSAIRYAAHHLRPLVAAQDNRGRNATASEETA
jgi:hypothetical protein